AKGATRMYSYRRHAIAALASALGIAAAARAMADSPPLLFNLEPFPDSTGVVTTYNVNGRIDTRNPFFQSLGSNGRSCATCHVASQAMPISRPDIRRRFDATHGQDPLFASVDGANCPSVKAGDRSGHSLLLQHGLIRVGIALTTPLQFSLSVIHDPYGCALV